MKNKNIRIGIIGGGPGGLSAAEALREKGYLNVIVLEKRDRVGGQSLSETYITPTGKKIIYELGSIQPVAAGSGTAHKLIKRYDIHLGKRPNKNKPLYMKLYDLETKKVMIDFCRYQLGRPLSFKNICYYIHDYYYLLKSLIRYRLLAKPGFEKMPNHLVAELAMPFIDWINKQNFILIRDDLKFLLGAVTTFNNAAAADEISAMNALKLLYPLMRFPQRYVNGSILQAREGYQELWRRVANANQVKLNVEIESIKREENKVIVTAKNESFQFDKIIFACSAEEILKMLDVTVLEQQIFSKVKQSPGWRAAFLAKNMPTNAAYFIPYSLFHKNEPTLSGFLAAGQVDQNTWLYECIIPERSGNMDAFKSALAKTENILQEHFGATDITWLNFSYWKEYGSHFDVDAVKRGIYQSLASLQGEHHTYFIGEMQSYGLHALVSDYSYYVVNKYF